MPKPKTAKVTLEILNDDGSKTIITSSDLDASKIGPIRSYRNERDHPNHMLVGMVDPWWDEDSDWFNRRERWVNDMVHLPPRESHFFLNVQLEPVKPNGPWYTIQEIEAPLKRLIMVWNPYSYKTPTVCSWTEDEIQNVAGTASENSIFFFLDIP